MRIIRIVGSEATLRIHALRLQTRPQHLRGDRPGHDNDLPVHAEEREAIGFWKQCDNSLWRQQPVTRVHPQAAHLREDSAPIKSRGRIPEPASIWLRAPSPSQLTASAA